LKKSDKPTDFGYHLTNFLSVYLPGQRGYSANTVESYGYTFSVFLGYCENQRKLNPDTMTLEQITKPLVEQFLDWLTNEKNNSDGTRNQRLSALHSFFRYVRTESPEQILKCQQILSIPIKKKVQEPVNYLAFEGIKGILEQPNLDTAKGRRNLCMLSLLYDTGARVSELCFAEVGHVRLENPGTIKLFGKGNKIRIVPLMEKTSELLRGYMTEQGLMSYDKHSHPLFWNNRGEKLTSAGVRYILDKYVEAAREAIPEYIPPTVSPHSLRHSKAVHLLQSGINIVYIRDILGHADLKTTEIYAKIDPKTKRETLESVYQNPNPEMPNSWHKDEGLMKWLADLRTQKRYAK
jgi:site-specific recombinase XerD